MELVPERRRLGNDRKEGKAGRIMGLAKLIDSLTVWVGRFCSTSNAGSFSTLEERGLLGLNWSGRERDSIRKSHGMCVVARSRGRQHGLGVVDALYVAIWDYETEREAACG